MSLDHAYGKSTLVPAIFRCRQARRHYLSQCCLYRHTASPDRNEVIGALDGLQHALYYMTIIFRYCFCVPLHTVKRP